MRLLDSSQLAEFLDVGYLVLRLDDVADNIHDRIYDACERAYEGMSSSSDSATGFKLIADDINTSIPDLNAILQSSYVSGALSSLLGSDYFRYNHSFIHRSGIHDQGFHKDSGLPWGTRGGIRSHRLNWLMVFYYPQTTTIDMGPTEILPGTQYWTVDREKHGVQAGEDILDLTFEGNGIGHHQDLNARDQQLAKSLNGFDTHTKPLKIEVPKGSVVLVHFDLFHRGTRQIASQSRFMVKYWFLRTTEPKRHTHLNQTTYKCTDPRRERVVQNCLDWLKVKEVDLLTDSPTKPEENVEPTEATLVDRAYRYAKDRDPYLLKEFSSVEESKRRAATQALTTAETFGVETALTNLESDVRGIRMSAAFVLGEVAPLATNVLHNLCVLACSDPDIDVRVTSCTALGRLFRRHDQPNQKDMRKVFEVLIEVIESTHINPSRRRIPTDALRQVAYIALLTIVSSTSIEKYQDSVQLLVTYLVDRVILEEDRYAKGTCVEIICRLANLQIPQAVQSAIALLRNERVNSVVSPL